jgi:shikimate kinase
MALGGGAVLRESNRQAIARTRGPVVWLTASVETILDRVAADKTTSARRPNLTTGGGRDEVESLLAQRMPLYRECATLVVNTEGKSAAEVADEIAAQLLR